MEVRNRANPVGFRDGDECVLVEAVDELGDQDHAHELALAALAGEKPDALRQRRLMVPPSSVSPADQISGAGRK